MRLEDQLSILQEFGFTLEPDIRVDDILYSFGRDELESNPFDLILFILGSEVEREPWGRRFCRRIWNFDFECIGQNGDYVRIVEELSNLAGKAGTLQAVSDHVDLDGGSGWLRYRGGWQDRHWDVKINDDWADPTVVGHIMRDLQTDSGRFYGKDNGQATILCYLTDDEAARLNHLCGGAWRPAVSDDAAPFGGAPARSKAGLLSFIRKWFGDGATEGCVVRTIRKHQRCLIRVTTTPPSTATAI